MPKSMDIGSIWQIVMILLKNGIHKTQFGRESNNQSNQQNIRINQINIKDNLANDQLYLNLKILIYY